MDSISTKSIVKRNPELISSNIDGETVMMSIENGEYFGLDLVGSRVWELIENPIEVDVLIDLLIEEFDVSRAECEVDTMEFLMLLLEKKLLIIMSTK